MCAKLEAAGVIRSKVIRGSQNFEFWSRDPDRAKFGVSLGSIRRRGPSSICVPNLKRITLFVQKLLGGPKIWNFGTGDPTFWRVWHRPHSLTRRCTIYVCIYTRRLPHRHGGTFCKYSMKFVNIFWNLMSP